MRRQLVTGLLMTIVMTVLLGLLYPLAMTGAAQVFARGKANGSFVSQNGKVVGSSLIGQSFTDRHGNPIPRYFQSRPSAAGDGYDARASGGTNWGPSAPQLITAVKARVLAYQAQRARSARAGTGGRRDCVGVGTRPRDLGRERAAA